MTSLSERLVGDPLAVPAIDMIADSGPGLAGPRPFSVTVEVP